MQNQGAQIKDLSEAQNQQQVQVQNLSLALNQLQDQVHNQGAEIHDLKNRQDQENEQTAARHHLHKTTPVSVNIGKVLYKAITENKLVSVGYLTSQLTLAIF